MRRDFWIDKRWPFDTPDFVFLGRAVDRIGMSLYPDQWDGGEFTADGEHWVPEAMSRANRVTRAYVSERMRAAFPDYLPTSRTLSPPSLNSLKRAFVVEEPSASDWKRGVELLKDETAHIAGQLQRRFETMNFIAERCAAGSLVSATRAIRGGALVPLKASAWQTEVWQQRFDFCQMQPARPFDLGCYGLDPSDGRYSYIFIGRESIATFERDKAKRAATFAEPAAAPPPRRKGGAPTTYNWPLIKGEFDRLMDENSGLIDADPAWRSQADIVRALEDYCDTTKNTNGTPSESSLKASVKKWYGDWSATRSITGD
jgi:hypothetical protein